MIFIDTPDYKRGDDKAQWLDRSGEKVLYRLFLNHDLRIVPQSSVNVARVVESARTREFVAHISPWNTRFSLGPSRCTPTSRYLLARRHVDERRCWLLLIKSGQLFCSTRRKPSVALSLCGGPRIVPHDRPRSIVSPRTSTDLLPRCRHDRDFNPIYLILAPQRQTRIMND